MSAIPPLQGPGALEAEATRGNHRELERHAKLHPEGVDPVHFPGMIQRAVRRVRAATRKHHR
jgi:hypothetical protein